jgi:hypothetical protein
MKATHDEIVSAVHVLWERNQEVSFASVRDMLRDGFHRRARVEAIGAALAEIRIGDKARWLIQFRKRDGEQEARS